MPLTSSWALTQEALSRTPARETEATGLTIPVRRFRHTNCTQLFLRLSTCYQIGRKTRDSERKHRKSRLLSLLSEAGGFFGVALGLIGKLGLFGEVDAFTVQPEVRKGAAVQSRDAEIDMLLEAEQGAEL